MPTAFETHARRLRFQALGKACREYGIETLLLGHHADDSVETTIWRLCRGSRGPGLAGIPEVARIPECHGIFGVAESGSSITLPAKVDGPSSRLEVRLDDNNRGRISFVPEEQGSSFPSRLMAQNPLSIATGGILLCRPLLSMRKESLVATCKENNIPYVDDPTNFDPTLTVRNAIRSLLSSNSLPRALRPPSILSLIRSSQSLLQSSLMLSNRLLQAQCQILDLNLRTGTMVMQFNPDTKWADDSELSPSRKQHIKCLALRRITELLSPAPEHHFPLSRFEAFTHVFHDHGGSGDSDNKAQGDYLSQRKPFVVGRILYSPLTVEPPSKASKGAQSSKDAQSLQRNIWLLSRSPFMQGTEPELRIDVPVSLQSPSATEPPPPAFTPWTLWDDRYWFRFSILHKPDPKLDQSAVPKIDKIPLRVRPFRKYDFGRIRNVLGALPGQDGRISQRRVQPPPALAAEQARTLLASYAPGPTRFTMPILTLEESSAWGQTGDAGAATADREHLLALPTIGHRFSGRNLQNEAPISRRLEIFYAGRRWIVGWEWMYKMIDTEVLAFMGKPVEADAYGTQEKV